MLPLLLTALSALIVGSSAATCTSKSLEAAGKPIDLEGVKIEQVIAESVKGWVEEPVPMPRALPLLPAESKPLDFCNVTILYSHPGKCDLVLRQRMTLYSRPQALMAKYV